MELRPISADDLAACGEVFYLAEDELQRRRGLPLLPRNGAALERLFGHITATDPTLAWLAEDAGRVVAFGMGARRGDLHFLSFLFVQPDEQGKGIGRRLLARCLPGDGRRATCVEAIQPVSAGLYAAHGLVPRVPIYSLIGQARAPLPDLPPDVAVAPAPAASGAGHDAAVGAMSALDREVLGLERRADHAAWLDWEREPFLMSDGESVLGYGYAHRSGRLGPVVVRHATLLLPLVARLTAAVDALDAWQVLVPGPADTTFVGLLSVGLRFEGPPALYCATEPGPDFSRYLPATFALP